MAFTLPTGGRGKALALSITLLAGAAICLGIIAPVWGWYDDRAEQLRVQTALAHRMTSLVETLPMLRAEIAALNGSPQAGRMAVLLTGANDPLAAAILQQRIEESAAAAGVHVGSAETLPGRPEGDLRAISVRVSLNGPFGSIVAFLLALARSDMPIVVDELQMRAQPAGPADEDPPIDANLTATSWRSAKADQR